MKRLSITFDDHLENKVQDYLDSQAVPPNVSTLVQVALHYYLDRQAWVLRQERPPLKPLGDLPICYAETDPDVSLNHDSY